MTKPELEALDLHDRSIIVIDNGKLVGVKSEGKYNLNLFSVFGFYVQIATDQYDPSNLKVEVVHDEKVISTYSKPEE